MPEDSYIKCYRSEEAKELLAANNKAFLLLYQIAMRAKRTSSFNRYNLDIGEALVGDFKEIGLTEGQYRQAKKFLAKHRFATFKGTNKGTIAKLVNTGVFDPNLENNNGQHNTPATNKQRASNEPTTTNKNDKKENNDKNEKFSPNVRIIDLKDAIKTKKQWCNDFRNKHCAEVAGGGEHWDPGTKEKYYTGKKELKKMEAELEELRQSGSP